MSAPGYSEPGRPSATAPGNRRRWQAALLALLVGCGNPTQQEARGGSTDTGNTIVALAGAILDAQGDPAGRSDLSLRRGDYLSPLPVLGKVGRSTVRLLDTVTDASGAFRIDSLDSGSYRLEVRQGNTLGLIYDAEVAPDTAALELPGRRLEKTGRVGGNVILRPDALRGYVQVYGMERLMAVDPATGRFDLLLPAGDFTLRFVDPEGGPATIKLREVTVAPGDSVDLGDVDLRDSTAPYPEWTHSRRLWINTTKDGADVAADVHDFPLLVRLDASMIDFSQAAPGGADLRFTKAGGSVPLAYEIERWDAAAESAEVWVRIDTVRGNSGDQYIHMFWGNPAARDSSSGSAVFDTALGFAGVWHLKEGSNDPGFPGYLDATANGNTGVGAAISDTSVGPGMIGRGQRLDGVGAYIKVPDAPSLDLGTGDFSLTVWARADAIFRTHQLVSKRVETGGDCELQLLADGFTDSYAGDSASSEALKSSTPVKPGEWHLYAMRRSGTVTSFYLDGALDASVDEGVRRNLDNDAAFFIGHDAQNLPEDWQGALDEVRLMRTAPPPEWLRLSFRTQTAASKVVSLFRP